MIKYAMIVDEESGTCNVGIGTDVEFYKSIGMQELDVEQSEVNGQWYLAPKCPHKTEDERIAITKISKAEYVEELKKLGIMYSQVKDLVVSKDDYFEQWDLNTEFSGDSEFLKELSKKLGLTDNQYKEIFKTKWK